MHGERPDGRWQVSYNRIGKTMAERAVCTDRATWSPRGRHDVSIPASAPIPPELTEAYAYCERIAREHYENFPVASFVLPAPLRPHVAAVYAFARSADDFADQPHRSPDERYRLLEDWREMLWLCATPQGAPLYSPLFRALGHTIRVCDLPLSLFEDLLSAFRQDVATSRYQTWPELMDYCRRSANPIGRLVLAIAGYVGPDIEQRSDCVCTALQLTNFWQDLAVDWRNGRLYVPAEESKGFGAKEEDLHLGKITPEWSDALRHVVGRTRDLFLEGRSICDLVRGRLRWELRVTWLGGMLVLDRLAASRFDVFRARPTVRRRDTVALAWRALRWQAAILS
jgi:hydroxysqualene synthase